MCPLAIQSKGNKYIITEDETFFDHSNQIPPKTLFSIAKNQADSVYFVNHDTIFHYTENYGLSALTRPNPKLVIFKKGGKYGYLSMNTKEKWFPSPLYDSIIIENGLIKCYLNGLVGYQGINDAPKYKSITKFDSYLARFEYPNGQKGYLDVDGQEYLD